MGFGGFFVLKIVVLFLMRGWANLNTTNQLNTQAKAIDIQAGYNGSLNESYHKTSGLSLAGLVGIGSLYTSGIWLF
jgi:hypothetical protein